MQVGRYSNTLYILPFALVCEEKKKKKLKLHFMQLWASFQRRKRGEKKVLIIHILNGEGEPKKNIFFYRSYIGIKLITLTKRLWSSLAIS